MSQENIEIVRRFYEAFNRGDVDGWTRLMSPNVEFVSLERGGGAVGAEQLVRDMDELTSEFASYEVFPEDFHDAGEQIVVVLRRSARSPRSPASIEDRFSQVISIQDGRIVRFQSFFGVEEALEAAGLRE
jgi:ketosteroid isomerase-like protein